MSSASFITKCSLPSPNVINVFTGVSMRVAVIMFVVSECHLDEENFSMLCPRHKVHKIMLHNYFIAAVLYSNSVSLPKYSQTCNWNC